MFNLLRMDLYRVIRSKSVYICFGVLLFMTAVSFGLWYLVASPEGLELAARIGLKVSVEGGRTADMLEGVDFLRLFRQIGLDGGSYHVIFGIWLVLFVCMDFQSGFMKNVMALYQNRWNYIGSKILTAGIVGACFLVLHLISALLLNQVFGVVPGSRWQDVAFYLSWAWLVSTAFGSLVIFVCVLTRSVAAGVLAAVLIGGGVVTMLLYELFDLFGASDWMGYTIYLTMSYGPGQYLGAADLYPYGVGAGFLVLYGILAGIILRKKDI